MINRKLIILAVVLSFITTMSAYWYLEKAKRSIDSTVFEKVIVAKGDIPAKTLVKADMVEYKNLPKDFTHQDSAMVMDAVVGKITSETIYAGETILNQKVVSKEENFKGLAYIIPKGKRAVSLPINEVSGVAGLIKPGDKVDVVATLDLDSNNNVGRVVQTSHVLQNIQVLAVNKNMTDAAENETGNEGQTTITLAVIPKDATPLILASEKGSVRLILRGHTDEEVTQVAPYKLSNFLREGEKNAD